MSRFYQSLFMRLFLLICIMEYHLLWHFSFQGKKGDMLFFSNPLCNVFSLYFMVYLGFVHLFIVIRLLLCEYTVKKKIDQGQFLILCLFMSYVLINMDLHIILFKRHHVTFDKFCSLFQECHWRQIYYCFSNDNVDIFLFLYDRK